MAPTLVWGRGGETGMRWRWWKLAPVLLTALLAGGPVAAAPAQQAKKVSPKPKYLVLIVMDGFRADYTSLAPTPALEALMHEGMTYNRAWVGQLESVTPTSHATLSTGRFPNHHGIIGFQWRDPVTRGEVIAGWDQNLQSSAIEGVLNASKTSSLPAAMKKAHPHAKVVSISSEKIYAADAWGGTAADYILYDKQSGKNLLVPTGVVGHEPPADLRTNPKLHERLPLKRFSTWDYLSANLATSAVKKFHPRMLMVNLPGADVYGHAYGGITAPGVMKRVVRGLDRDIARIVHAYKAAGIYKQTLFVVTADHGMSPNIHAISSPTVSNVIRQSGATEMFHTGGTASYIYLRDPQHSRRVAVGMTKVHGVVASYYQVRRGKTYSYVPAPGVTIPANLDAAYRYLLSTVDGPTAPDVAAPFREDTIGQVRDYAYGHHGGLNWGVQHIPLVLEGPGIRVGQSSRAPARLVDIAATMAHELNLSLPGMDGMVLSDALVAPTQAEVTRQGRLSPSLTADQNALIAGYTQQVTKDRRQALHPPELAPRRP
jgi:predicted AlkP superfamily pyrophosphatase or phosphodiesterase